MPDGIPREVPAVAPSPHAAQDRAFRWITEAVLSRVGAGGPGYAAGLLASAALMGIGFAAWGVQLTLGMGTTGLQHPMMWAVYITDFVWWIGIAHGGTILPAILFLFRASFRTAFSRAAEAMTLIAILTSAAF